ncbi:DUF692 domain-containing protein [Rhodoferax sp.]|uniref:MNIO family bufferin maturase n=1 Tax=Rhodoferax sp. TaxID=50421 RepID=UPI0026178D96|nr:DUF692 domain-containing protein [Rhodoferax sp.]MDD2808015.1 DUF692 domain-containing protein [Rhodoferax sp.]MDD4942050.1 DUF692 domain-containing protein [Rhodoferax sp.]MDD5478528.1 DUF692 domain-containing protein [Rhodoferax sp.]
MLNPSSQHTPPQVALTPTLPTRAGVGLKPEHFQEILATQPDIGFFEVHAENYMVAGGPFHHYLSRIHERYALSVHGVCLSIGADAPLDIEHLNALQRLLDKHQPQSFSEHLAWSTHGATFLNDLLPVPYNTATLQRVCDHIDQVQAHLQRRMLLENPATYVEFAASTWDEAAFISEVVRRTGCGLLLDVNNVYVSSVNHQRDAQAVIRALPLAQVGEIHLAGFAEQVDGNNDRLLIDSHGSPVAQAMWDLYAYTLTLTGPVATLLERDNDIPTWPVLLAEATLAEGYLHPATVGQPPLAEQQALHEVAA